VIEHKARAWPGFTQKYDVTQLVWFETHETREEAFVKERRMKTWKRVWKLELIERKNPTWRDLFGTSKMASWAIPGQNWVLAFARMSGSERLKE
jgi:predicted GIY-YIG superfamily endonuclease